MGASTYCQEFVNGRRCQATIVLPVPYTMIDVMKAVCPDCQRAKIAAIASTEVPEWRENVAPAESKGSCGPVPGVTKGSVTSAS